MSLLNKTSSVSHTEFILFGFPGITKLRPLLVLPFSSIYTMIVISNLAVMTIIVLEKCLLSPMYILVSSLLAVNVLYTTAITPKMILALVGLNQISLFGCLMQTFIVYAGDMSESIVLLLMDLDRYLAIRHPLRYSHIVSKYLLVTLTINGIIRYCFLVLPLVIQTSQIDFCRSNIIQHFYCENAMLFSLGCGDVSRAITIRLLYRTLFAFFDIIIIFISYLKILLSVMKIAVGASRYKALHTCSTHLLVVVLMYSTGLLTSISYLPQISTSYHMQNISSALHFLFPAFSNPFIYGLRMKEIKDGFRKHWRTKENISLKLKEDKN